MGGDPALPPQKRPAEAELAELQGRIDGLRARMRAAIDLLGVLLLGISGAAMLVVTVLAVVGFAGGDTGIGLLFSSLSVICLPLVAFAAWRAFHPLWRLSKELDHLRVREQQLLSQLAPAGPPSGRGRGGARPVGGMRAPDPRLPAGRSPTGWKAPPRRGVAAALSTKQVGWRVAAVIGLLTALFAAGVLAGVLARN